MLRNYFKIAFRNLIRNKISSFINMSGLAVGLAAGILILLFTLNELNYDKFHKNLSSIHLLLKNFSEEGNIYTEQSLPGLLAAELRSEIPDIKYAAQTSYESQQLLHYGDKIFYEQGIYTEPDFFNIMTFPAVAGNPIAALQEPNSVVITERTAKKLFENENAIGKILKNNNLHELKVAAVIQDVPENSTLQFDVVLPFKLYTQINSESVNRWDYHSMQTWIALQPEANLITLNKKIKNILADHLENETPVLFAYPLEKLHLYSDFRNGKPRGGLIDILWMLGIIGAFVLLIACINFMNLATARSERRAREVGVRKVMGAQRRGIIGQFLVETFLLTFLALGLSLVLAELALPIFNQVLNKNLFLSFSNWQLWSILFMLGLITAIVAGSYPVFFLSGFQPVRVLKGTVLSGKGGSLLRKGLVSFQFFISVFLIISTIVIFKQLKYVQNRPLGYDLENLVGIPAQGDMGKNFNAIKNDLLQIPGVKNVSAGSDNLLGFGGSTNDIQWPGKTAEQDFRFIITHVQYDWTKTVGLKIVEGRDFSRDFGSDAQACLLNQAAVQRMGLSNPVGKIINNGTPIIGVVNDFVYNNPNATPNPMIIYLSNNNLNHFFVRIQNDENWQKSLAQMEQVVKRNNPNFPSEFHFLKEEYQKKFEGITKTSRMITLFGGLAIFIAALGLFGLSAFVAERRKKEIGIRKVLGATVANVWMSLSADFMKPVILGFVLSLPVAFWAMQQLLSNFDYHIELSWWIFALAGVIAIGVALLTVSFQAIRAAVANPVESLKNE